MNISSAKRLATLVRDCERSGVARNVLLLRADRLPAGLSRPHHLRLAQDALEPLLGASRALLFHLPGPRFAVTWRGDAETILLDALQTLQLLLEDAPGSPSLPELVFLYELPRQGNLLLRALEEAPGPVEPPADSAGLPLDADTLADLEAALAQADVARFARRRPVWRLTGPSPVLAWEKRTLSVQELAASLLPGYELQAEPWLFRRLTRTLDRRMLALLASPGELAEAGPFALDLNVASVLSPEFLRFDAVLPSPLRGRVILALTPADIMADVPGFIFARAFARTRGYRLMLRHVTPELIDMLSVDVLEMDHLQLRWTPCLAEAPAESIGAASPGGFVLFRANDPAALEWGMHAGIRFFQGAAADHAALGVRSNAA